MKHLSILAAILPAWAIISCDCPGAPSAATTDGTAALSSALVARRGLIEENNSRFTKAHVTGDHAVIDGMFTRDAKVLPPDSEPVIGRDAIAKLTKQYIEFGITEFREETTDFYGTEDLLVDQGSYVMVYGKDKTMEKGKYLNVWKREEGTWKIYSNIWNSNGPTAPAK
jgi:ketosteroid isomerase-like protein